MDLDAHLEALTDNLKAEHSEIVYVTLGQIRGLNILLKQGLRSQNRGMRIAVLGLLAGPAMKDICNVDIQSSKNLTSPVASFLISLLKDPESPEKDWYLSEYGIELLAAAEKRIEESSVKV
jgi:hypothetical protein